MGGLEKTYRENETISVLTGLGQSWWVMHGSQGSATLSVSSVAMSSKHEHNKSLKS